MGVIKHNCIIVTDWKRDELKLSHEKAIEVFGEMVSPIVQSPYNGYLSFFIASDGSKEGWEDSDVYDKKRREFCDFLDDNFIPFIDIGYGETDNGNPGSPIIERVEKKRNN